jgi:hypothetical protein
MFVFLHTEPFRRWLATQPLGERALMTLAGIALAARLLL